MTRRKLVLWAFITADSAVLILSLYVAASLFDVPAGWLSMQNILDLKPRLQDIVIFTGFLIIWLMLFKYVGLYKHRSMSFMKFRHYHMLDLVMATSLGTLLLSGTAFLFGLKDVSAWFVFMFWSSETLGTLVAREALILILRLMRIRGRNLRHLLIVGTNYRAQEFAHKIDTEPELGYALRGFIDNNWQSRKPDDIDNAILVADLQGIGAYLKDHVVDEVVIALPLATLYDEASRIVKLCEEQGVVVHFVPGFDFLNLGSSCMAFNTLHDEPIITVIPPPMSGWKFIIKRTIDVVVSFTLITLLLPAFILISILIKYSSPGSVLFSQERVGLNKRKFKLLKLRTMVTNAEELLGSLEHLNEAGGPVFKIQKDPRITPVGSFLRRTSLDELPQLFNVLWGDMSLVGPRPLPLRDYKGFDQDWHRRRFSVRPGITCIWQISGRSSITFEKWMELDMEYINNWSLWLDLKILLATIPAVMKQSGAM